MASHRSSAASGIAFVVLIVASFLLFGLDFPTYDDSGRKFAAYYAIHQDRIQQSTLLAGFAVVAFVWFASFIRWLYRGAETASRGFARATDIGFGAAIAGAAVSSVAVVTPEVAVVATGTVEPGVIRALDLLGDYAVLVGGLFFSVWLMSSFFVIRVTNIFPVWLAYLAVVGSIFGVLQAVLLLAPQDDDGVLGLLGLISFILFLIWTLAASIAAARRVEAVQA